MNYKDMKKHVLTLVLALCTLAPALAQNPQKLGHIDRQQLMLMLPERKDAETKMQEFAKQLELRLKAMGAEYEQKRADAEGKVTTMTNTEKEVALRELQELEKRIMDAQNKAEEDLQKQEEELLAPMVKRTTEAIKAVAQENGFTYVFDSSVGIVLYFERGEDLMPLVKTKLGIK
ncbi:MAG: OmpH family outer membrane protein [Flavobacteriales bacterium]|nr:OmpH family outer membrane protein [Flavobacteriales bacterium]